MATNKNQHFVPRCYLRPFTRSGEGKAINVYNIDRNRFILNAPVKNQCSRDYFYGQDPDLENAIQMAEGAYANALREVSSAQSQIPAEHIQTLRLFWLLQYLRTEAAARRAAIWAAEIANHLGDESPVSFGKEIKEAVQVGMAVFAKEMHAIDDVRVCIFRNCTDIPFITSDDPAILTNRWMLIDPARAARSFGIGSAGCLFVLPLSPELLFLGYDSDVYSIPQKNGWTRVKRGQDIDALNQLQILNCRANVFVEQSQHEDYVREAVKYAASLRPEHSHSIHFAILESQSDGIKRFRVVSEGAEQANEELVHLQTRHPKPSKWPQQLTWKPLGRAYFNGTGAGYLRAAHIPRDAETPFYKVRTNQA